MNRIRIWVIFIPAALIGCIASKQSYTSLSKGQQYIKDNITYDTIQKTHKVSKNLLDEIAYKNHSVLDTLVGLNITQVTSILGKPDRKLNSETYVYDIGKCPEKMNCASMYFNAYFSNAGICAKIEFGIMEKPSTWPGK
ncbi:MAG: hypothetical protein JWO03_1737 [Bacteroidetes bacterium]|nr:hypothetical protein [Bacteroidota bacterium]